MPATEVSRLVGLILIVLGTFWLVLTGLCTTAFAIGLLGEGNLGDITVILTVAIPSALLGGIIYLIGRWLRPK